MPENKDHFDAYKGRYEAMKKAHENAYNNSDYDEDDDDRIGIPAFEDGHPLEEEADEAFSAAKAAGYSDETLNQVEVAVEEYEKHVREYNGDDVVDEWTEEHDKPDRD